MFTIFLLQILSVTVISQQCLKGLSFFHCCPHRERAQPTKPSLKQGGMLSLVHGYHRRCVRMHSSTRPCEAVSGAVK